MHHGSDQVWSENLRDSNYRYVERRFLRTEALQDLSVSFTAGRLERILHDHPEETEWLSDLFELEQVTKNETIHSISISRWLGRRTALSKMDKRKWALGRLSAH